MATRMQREGIFMGEQATSEWLDSMCAKECQRVVEALGPWLDHRDGCRGISITDPACTCGLADKLAELEKP